MITVIKHPKKEDWNALMRRAECDTSALTETVKQILSNVAQNGDKALREYSERFDGAIVNDFKVSAQELEECDALVSQELKVAIEAAAENIRKFHAAQVPQTVEVTTMAGVNCQQRAVPISKVGLYIPGGNSPLFSTVLMLAIPAKIAGCREIVLTTPPNAEGKVHPAILFAAKVAGVTQIFKVGGAQGIGAMAYGTESVPKVYKIFGPGNMFVMEAKQQVSLDSVAIDMPAGPSEVLVIADKDANLEFVATDFLSQAEHGKDSQSILLTTDTEVVERFSVVVEDLAATLPKGDLISSSLANSRAILLNDYEELMEFCNDYAPEHLIINTDNAYKLTTMVENAGSVFIGPYSPESAGDYASGTNHTLPTSGYAKSYSGVNLDSFIKKITFQEITREGLSNIGEIIETLAENESLMAHKLAVTVRLKEINNGN